MPDTSTEIGDTKGVSSSEECDSPSKWITPICPFEPGEEAEARKFLVQPPKTPALQISRREMRRSVAEVVAGIAAAVTIVFYPLVGLLKRGHWPPVGDVAVATAIIAAPLWAIFRVMLRSRGPFVVSPQQAKIFLGGKQIATLDELGVPRLGLQVHSYEDEGGEDRERRWPVIVMQRDSQDDLRLFDDPVLVSWKVLNRMDEIADHINALLAEYHQRKAVERWLAEREAEQDQQRIYR